VSSSNRYAVLMRMFDHVDAHARTALPAVDRTPAPWESSMQATCECLSWRGTWSTQDRRRTEDELGESLYAEFPHHTRQALVAAHALLDKGVITPEELSAKMKEVRARLESA
jgi:hypothetical protein